MVFKATVNGRHAACKLYAFVSLCAANVANDMKNTQLFLFEISKTYSHLKLQPHTNWL